jgi:hypothetical protein
MQAYKLVGDRDDRPPLNEEVRPVGGDIADAGVLVYDMARLIEQRHSAIGSREWSLRGMLRTTGNEPGQWCLWSRPVPGPRVQFRYGYGGPDG